AGFRREGTVALLRDRYAAAGNDERAGGRDVERAGAIAAGPDRVDRPGRSLDRERLGAHDAGRAGDLVDALSSHPERHQKSADLRWGRIAAHDDLEGRLGLAFAQMPARRDRG